MEHDICAWNLGSRMVNKTLISRPHIWNVIRCCSDNLSGQLYPVENLTASHVYI